MNTEKLFAISGQIDDRFVEETMELSSRRPRYARFIAAAAAVLLLIGAGFVAHKAIAANRGTETQQEAEHTSLPALDVLVGSEPFTEDFYASPSESSLRFGSVHQPSQTEEHIGEACYFRGYDITQLYSESTAVCLVTIRSRLSENGVGTYFEAEVDRMYKGELPDRIVIFQMGNSKYHMDGSPLYTCGDKLLVGLTPLEHSSYDNAYEIVGADIAMLYAAVSKAGETYLFDHRGVLSYNTERNMKGRSFTNYASDAELVGELLDSVGVYDAAICDELRGYYNSSKMGGPMSLHIYSLEEIEAFFAEAERS